MAAVDTASGVTKLRDALVPGDHCRALVGLFYRDEGSFAGTSFLDVDTNEPNRITAADLLAVTFMGEIFPPLAVRQLMHGDSGDEVEALLTDIPERTELLHVSDGELHDENGPYIRLWRALTRLHDVGPTKASKLMARKRPALFPIYDSVVGERIAPVDDYWHVFRAFFDEPDWVSLVDNLRSEAVSKDLPALRVIDTAVWMRYSRGRSAIAARAEVGL